MTQSVVANHGAVGTAATGSGALGSVPGSHLAFFLAMAPAPEMATMGRAATGAAVEALAPWTSGRHFLNLAERPVDPSTAYEPGVGARLREVRAAVDPNGLFVAAHEVPAAD